MAVGRLLSLVIFGRARTDGLAATATGFVALAATLVAYGTTELFHGYGFLAVFVAAVTIRGVERTHDYVQACIRSPTSSSNSSSSACSCCWGWRCDRPARRARRRRCVLGLTLVFVVRPLACRVALTGGRVAPLERRAIGFFGIRGIGSIYYLAYATTDHDFPEADRMWAIVTFTVLLSIAVHGVVATPAMQRVDRYRRRRHRRAPVEPATARSFSVRLRARAVRARPRARTGT